MNYINTYLEYLKKNKGYSDNTIKSYLNDYQEFIKYIKKDIINVDNNDIKKYLEYLYYNNQKKTTISHKISALKSLYNYLETNNYIKQNPLYYIKLPKKDKILPKYLKKEMTEKLIASVNVGKYQYRDKLILELLYTSGMRVSELVNTKINDINFDNNAIHVTGKGNKDRIVYFSQITRETLNKYLESDYNILNKNKSEYLILNKEGNKLSVRFVEKLINKYTILSGVDQKVTPHVLRHSFATEMIEAGADLISVKELLGHTSVNTTSIYTHISNKHLIEVYKKAHPRAER